jgi:hypothetical protein
MKEEYIDRFLDISKKCYIKMKEYSTTTVKGSRKQIRNPRRENLEQYSFMTPFTNGLRRWFSLDPFSSGLFI